MTKEGDLLLSRYGIIRLPNTLLKLENVWTVIAPSALLPYDNLSPFAVGLF